ncbi:MAG: pentatricopeptide repeat-containing protein [Candidatus Calescibacterium sp.]|nr:pentatricopeptide repeat-containing protein [Candidatus Calescibacterium sp.]MDW8133105.1 pentatricopeptide repeat-containing protein [Candidatus Calescibacterium sp.]
MKMELSLHSIGKNQVITNIKERINDLKKEFENTPVNDQYSVSALRGSINAGLWGSMVGGSILGISSATGSIVGNIVGKKTGNPLISIAASAISSAGLFTLLSIYFGMGSLVGIAVGALSAAITSNIGNLTSTSSKEMNDSNYFALKNLPVVLLANLPSTLLAVSTLASQLPHIFDTNENKKLYIALLSALGLGFGLGMIGGPLNAAIFASLSAIFATINFKLSPKVEGFFQKISNFVSNKVAEFLTPKLSFLSKLPDKIKAAIAGLLVGGLSTIGATTLATLVYPILGPIAFAIPFSVFLLTSFSTGKKILDMKIIQDNTQKYISIIQKYLQENNIDKAIDYYREMLNKNIELSNLNQEDYNNAKYELEKLSNEQLKQIMFNHLSNLYLSNSVKSFLSNYPEEAVNEFKKIIVLEKVFSGESYQESEKYAKSIPSQKILEYIKSTVEQLETAHKNN